LSEVALVLVGDLPAGALKTLLARYDLEVVHQPPGAPIPGSYWGEPEAGVVGRTLHVRPDTPVQSALHEGCHLICAHAAGRSGLDTDAGGTDTEENAVCYLQILLADELPGVGRERMMRDMDAWGYSFRLGSASAWFAGDAVDAAGWLEEHGLLQEARPGGVGVIR
jgi:hypothetical protein